MDTPKKYKTDGVNRFQIGLWSAFGKGLEKDDDNNIIFDYLEISGFRGNTTPFGIDRTTYGIFNVTSLEEKRFENVSDYQDNNGDPDYINNVDSLYEMKSEIYGEIAYYVTNDTSGNIEITVENGPLIINDTDLFNLFIISNGIKINVPINAIIFENYCDETIDRIHSLKKRTFTLNLDLIDQYTGSSLILEKDDIIVCNYTYFTHTDMARAGDEHNNWESGNSTDTTIEIEFFSKTTQQVPINHIELYTSKINYPTGAFQYIIQAIEENVYNTNSYRLVKDGYLDNVKNGEISVIKFDMRYVKKLRLILIGSTGGSFIETNLYINDPDLTKYYQPYGKTDTLELDDFYKISLQPVYVNPNSPEKHFVNGKYIQAGDLLEKENLIIEGIIRLYTPYKYNGEEDAYKDYILSYYNIYYGGVPIYKGIPNPFLLDDNLFEKLMIESNDSSGITIGVCEPSDYIADIYHIFEKDYLILNNKGGQQTFYTKFSNIVQGHFKLFEESSNGNITELIENQDYFFNTETGSVILNNNVYELPVGYNLFSKYIYKVKKQNTASDIANYVHFLRGFGWRDAIRYSSIRVYPRQYFLEYYSNNSSKTYKFEINPSGWDNQIETNQTLQKTLGGTYRKQKFGSSKNKFTIKGEFMSDDMMNELRIWEQESKELGLVDDMLILHKGFIVPGSLSGSRRKTNQEEQENETTSWTWSLVFQEI